MPGTGTYLVEERNNWNSQGRDYGSVRETAQFI